MRTIEHEGKLYRVLVWQKPEDTEYDAGHVCYGVYPAKYGDGPYLIVAKGDKTFKTLYFTFTNGDPQPLYVLDIPAIPELDCLVEWSECNLLEAEKQK